MNLGRIIFFIFTVLSGGLMFVFAEIDDSPGGQLLGILVALIGAVVLLRGKKSH